MASRQEEELWFERNVLPLFHVRKSVERLPGNIYAAIDTLEQLPDPDRVAVISNLKNFGAFLIPRKSYDPSHRLLRVSLVEEISALSLDNIDVIYLWRLSDDLDRVFRAVKDYVDSETKK